MSLLGSLYTGISGLKATGASLGVIGDNIANANTTGFKASRAEFKDVMASSLSGVGSGNQAGKGVQLASITSIFKQGNITPTERDTDMAIQGDGFFVTKARNGEVAFTRDGAFRFDDKGNLTTSEGRYIQGYKIDPATKKRSAELTNVQFSSNTMPAKATNQVRINANLNVGTEPNKYGYDLKNADKQADYSTSLRVYDSTGVGHTINVHFYKRAGGEWDWHGSVDGSEVEGGTKGVAKEIVAGKLTFTEDGKLATDKITKSEINFKGAKKGQEIDFNFGDAIISRNGTGMEGTTSYGSKTQVYRQLQDGYAAGTLTNFSIDDAGIIYGSYSNGTTLELAQLALAKFENNEGLSRVGGSLYKEVPSASGQPLIGVPQEGGRGLVQARALENSTVDLANEFVNMIQTQRNFQANAKTITTTDELLTELINMKR